MFGEGSLVRHHNKGKDHRAKEKKGWVNQGKNRPPKSGKKGK
ncbi:MAG: hypothetical protein V4449_01400 [Patescibacteria group bacterium]